MKAFTDLEQSKKLAEILPVESADMCYCNNSIKGLNYTDEFSANLHSVEEMKDIFDSAFNEWDKYWKLISCWSLCALLEMLPSEISRGEKFADDYQIDIRKYDGESNTTWYQIAYGNNRGSSGEWHDMINTGEKENLIDCCFQMILLLKEKDLI